MSDPPADVHLWIEVPDPADDHIWVEVTDLDDLPARVWMCNAHPGELRRQYQLLPAPEANDPPPEDEGSR